MKYAPPAPSHDVLANQFAAQVSELTTPINSFRNFDNFGALVANRIISDKQASLRMLVWEKSPADTADEDGVVRDRAITELNEMERAITNLNQHEWFPLLDRLRSDLAQVIEFHGLTKFIIIDIIGNCEDLRFYARVGNDELA